MPDTPPIELVDRGHDHPDLAAHLADAAPTFEPSDDPVLRRFAAVFADSGLYSLDVNRETSASVAAQFDTYDDLSVISRAGPDAAAETFCTGWAPVGRFHDPREGFGDGPDSTLLGHFARRPMPDGWRLDALLLVVTSPFVHLSATADPLVVQGAFDTGDGYRYLELLQP